MIPALSRRFAAGRWPRGVAAWLASALAASPVAATATVGFLLVRETVAYPPFHPEDWWIFTHLWRPLAIGGLVLAPLFSAPLAALAIWAIRRRRWPRPLADIVAGAVCGLASLALVIVVVRTIGPMADGP